MLLSKLNEMSVGPMWILRAREDVASEVGGCPICHKPWQKWSVEEPSVLVVLASPITDEAQQKLLENCMQAAGWLDQSSCFSLHASCSSESKPALDALKEQMAAESPEQIIVFGQTAAQLIKLNNAELVQGKINQYANSRLVITHHPEEMITTPALKAQVWADLCLAKFGEE